MRLAAVSLVFLVGCRFELPQAAPVDVQGEGGIDARPDALPDALPDAPGCPADFAPLPDGPPGHVYRLRPQLTTRDAHFNFCKSTSARAYLAVPKNATELMNLHAVASAPDFWVGIDDRVNEGVYVSAETGAPATFLPWAAGEPTGFPTGGDCVVASAAAIFDTVCDGNHPAVCECNP
jgi:hypothetical protein